VKKISITADGARRRTTQNDLYVPSGPEPEQMEVTLAKIRNIVGEHRVGTPVLLNTHQPDNFELRNYSVPVSNAPVKAIMESPPSPSCAALRLFRPPVLACVELRQQRPISITVENQKRTILRATGPWRSSGNWWDESWWSRDEWDIALASKPKRSTQEGTKESIQGTYRLYQDLLTRKWFLEGAYD